MALIIRELWGHAALQDAGRRGRRHVGVPESGPFDRVAWQLANAVVGNGEPLAAIELAFGEIALESTEHHRVGVVGAAERVWVDDLAFPARTALTIGPGSTLRIAGPAYGARTQIAAEGGFRGRLVLGSVCGEVLARGVRLDAQRAERDRGPMRLAIDDDAIAPWRDDGPIRVVRGPHAAEYEASVDDATYAVNPVSDRLGIRLDGPDLGRLEDLPSFPVTFGSIQITHAGTPIVLGPDGPTIGGYPVAAVVITADLDRLAHLTPGHAVRFQTVSQGEAAEAYRQRSEKLERWLRRIALAVA